jgi:hypothetical protein
MLTNAVCNALSSCKAGVTRAGSTVRSDHERDIERSGAALANSRPIRGGARALQIGSPSFSCDYGAGFRTSENASIDLNRARVARRHAFEQETALPRVARE